MRPDQGDSRADPVADDELIARHLCGQRDAFAALVDRYARQVYAIAYRISGDHTEAEDLTQDTFLRAFRALPTLRQHRAFAGWLYRVATTTCLDARRRRCGPRQIPLDTALAAILPDEARWSSPPDAVLAAEDQRTVRVVLRRLAPRQRAALTLYGLHGLSYAETAQALGANSATVAVLICRARRRFRMQYVEAAARGD